MYSKDLIEIPYILKDPQIVKAEHKDSLKSYLYYKKGWKRIKGLIVFPYNGYKLTEDSKMGEMINTALELGYALLVSWTWEKAPNDSGINYHNVFTSHVNLRNSRETENILNYIEQEMIGNISKYEFIEEDTDIILIGSSRGGIQNLTWSSYSNNREYSIYNRVKAIVSVSPFVGGNLWAQPLKCIRALCSHIQNSKHPSMILIPINDVTHLNKEFSNILNDFLDMLNDENKICKIWGDNTTFDHYAVQKNQKEFIEEVISFYELIKLRK